MLPDLLKSLSGVGVIGSFTFFIFGTYYSNFSLWVPVITLIGFAIAYGLNHLSNWLEEDQRI
jgi:hypothetical protein